MATQNIFQHVSFFTLEESQKKFIRDFSGNPELALIDTNEVFQNKADMSIVLDFWDNRISAIRQFASHPDSFKSLTKDHLAMLQDELSFAYYIFYARYKLTLAEGLGSDLSDHGEPIKLCRELLEFTQKGGKADSLPTVADDHVKFSLEWMSAFNERRLYWVWAGSGGLLGSLIALFPDDYFNKLQAMRVLDIPVPFAGSLSWALYYFRCLVRLGILIKHVIPGPWMSKDEQSIPWTARFSAQWEQMKFYLLNDFFWANGNLACYFWLFGAADFYGGALTSVLLLLDVSVSIWAYWDERVQYDKDMARFKLGIQKLTVANAPAYQINALKFAERQCMLDRNYRLYNLYADMLYAISLLLAFSLIYCFYLPLILSASTALALALTGTILCFSLNALFAAIKQGMDVCKSEELLHYAVADHKDKTRNQFDLQFLESQWIYHKNMIDYKKICMLRSVLIDFLVPPVIFLALVFMPLSLGLSVITAGLLIAVASYYYIEKYYEHDMGCLPPYRPDIIPSPDKPLITQGFFGKTTPYLSEIQDHEQAVAIAFT